MVSTRHVPMFLPSYCRRLPIHVDYIIQAWQCILDVHFTLFCTKISRSYIHLSLCTIPTILLVCLMDVEPHMFLTKWHKPLDWGQAQGVSNMLS